MKIRTVILAAAVAGAAATFLPWEVTDRMNGDGRGSYGWHSFGAFCAVAACTAYKPVRWIRAVLVLAATVALSVALMRIRELGIISDLNVSSYDVETRKMAVQLRPGHGVYLVIGAAIVTFFGALLWRRRHPGERQPELPRATLRT